MSERPGRAALVTTLAVFGALLALANAWGLALFAENLQNPDFSLAGAGFTEKLLAVSATLHERHPGFFWFFFAVPLALFGFAALLVGLRRETAVAPVESAAAAPPQEERQTPALQLLALLQQEGRLIDFLEEEIDAYSDEQVGAAARTIHDGCRKALHERMEIARVYEEADGSSIEVAADYDPSTLRLTGNVHGDPPFRGTLEHGGWRVDALRLPDSTGGDPRIIAPAEVEIA